MNVFEHLASVLNTFGGTFWYGLNKDIEAFKERKAAGKNAFFISWNTEDMESHLEGGRVGYSTESVTVYYKLPAPDRQGATISLTSIYAVGKQLDEYNTFTDDVLRRTKLNSITPIESDLNSIIEYDLTVF